MVSWQCSQGNKESQHTMLSCIISYIMYTIYCSTDRTYHFIIYVAYHFILRTILHTTYEPASPSHSPEPHPNQTVGHQQAEIEHIAVPTEHSDRSASAFLSVPLDSTEKSCVFPLLTTQSAKHSANFLTLFFPL